MNILLNWAGSQSLNRIKRRGLWRRIIGQLISLAENENLFATTRADARAMRFAPDYGFKPAGEPYPSGRGYDLVLLLRNVEERMKLCLVTGQTRGVLLCTPDVRRLVNRSLKFFATNQTM